MRVLGFDKVVTHLMSATNTQRPRDCLTAALCCRFNFAVTDVGVAQRHTLAFVAKQARDDGQGKNATVCQYVSIVGAPAGPAGMPAGM